VIGKRVPQTDELRPLKAGLKRVNASRRSQGFDPPTKAALTHAQPGRISAT